MKIAIGLVVAVALTFVVVGGLLYGLLTPTEAGAVAVNGGLVGVGLVSLLRR